MKEQNAAEGNPREERLAATTELIETARRVRMITTMILTMMVPRAMLIAIAKVNANCPVAGHKPWLKMPALKSTHYYLCERSLKHQCWRAKLKHAHHHGRLTAERLEMKKPICT